MVTNMDFSIQLSAYYPDKSYGGDRLYRDMLEQAVAGRPDRFRCGVDLTEHHLINILLMPAPLALRGQDRRRHRARKDHDVGRRAAAARHADLCRRGRRAPTSFTEGRLMLGVGRGAFGFEMDRLGVPLDSSREKFDESLNLLAWPCCAKRRCPGTASTTGSTALTVMPRPVRRRRPADHDGRAGARRRSTTARNAASISRPRRFGGRSPADAGPGRCLQRRGKAELGEAGPPSDPVPFARRIRRQGTRPTGRSKIQAADDYYSRFDNVFTGPGIVERGMIASSAAEADRRVSLPRAS